MTTYAIPTWVMTIYAISTWRAYVWPPDIGLYVWVWRPLVLGFNAPALVRKFFFASLP
jgi:hypothetical protein